VEVEKVLAIIKLTEEQQAIWKETIATEITELKIVEMFGQEARNLVPGAISVRLLAEGGGAADW
jgi:hypothetical protein